MKRLLLAAAALLLVACAAVSIYTALRATGDGRTESAVSVAMLVMQGDDPTAGTGVECDLAPGPELALLRARYRCRLYGCYDDTFARLEVEDRPGEKWGYRIEGDTVAWVEGSAGSLVPRYSPGPTLCEQSDCVEDVEGAAPTRLRSWAGDAVRGRPSGRVLTRALPGVSPRRLRRASYEVVDVDLDEARAIVRASFGREEVRLLEIRNLDGEWELRPY